MLKLATLLWFVSTSLVAAEEIVGRIEAVDRNGVLHTDTNVKLLVWGLDETSVADLAEFLTGRRIVCLQLDVRDDIVLGDCGLVGSRAMSGAQMNILNMATWLPEFSLADPSCEVGSFPQEFRIKNEAYGDIHFLCSRGTPFRGVLSPPSSLY